MPAFLGHRIFFGREGDLAGVLKNENFTSPEGDLAGISGTYNIFGREGDLARIFENLVFGTNIT